MRAEQIFISLVALLLGLILFLTGAFLFIGASTSFFSENLLNFLKEKMNWVGGIGIALMLLSTLLIIAFYSLSRRHYFFIEMGNVHVRDRVLAEMTKSSLQKLFPNESIVCDVMIHRKGKIEVLANLPYISDEKKEEWLNTIEKQLVHLFVNQCGLNQEFLFNVSFGKVH